MIYAIYDPILAMLLGIWGLVLGFGIYKHIINIKIRGVSHEEKNLILYLFIMYVVSFFIIYFFNYIQTPVKRFGYIYYTGVFISLIAIVFGVWSIANYREFWSFSMTIFKNQEIICKGPNAIVRHPFYLSNFLFLLGYSLALGTLLSILGAFVALGILMYMADLEERFYSEKLGEAYIEYMKKVKYKIIPFIY